jgi:hypothetical protein
VSDTEEDLSLNMPELEAIILKVYAVPAARLVTYSGPLTLEALLETTVEPEYAVAIYVRFPPPRFNGAVNDILTPVGAVDGVRVAIKLVGGPGLAR